MSDWDFDLDFMREAEYEARADEVAERQMVSYVVKHYGYKPCLKRKHNDDDTIDYRAMCKREKDHPGRCQYHTLIKGKT